MTSNHRGIVKLRRPAVLDVLLACGVAYAALALCAVLFLYIPSIADVSLPVPDDALIKRIEQMAMRGALLCSVSASVLSLCVAALIRRRLESRLSAGVAEDTSTRVGSPQRSPQNGVVSSPPSVEK